MLNLSNFRFCPVDFNFIYPKGSDKAKLDSLTPSYVKINGFCFNDNGLVCICRIFDEFKSFGLAKDTLADYLCSQRIIKGSGYLSNDNSYNKVLNLDKYVFKGSYNIDLKE